MTTKMKIKKIKTTMMMMTKTTITRTTVKAIMTMTMTMAMMITIIMTMTYKKAITTMIKKKMKIMATKATIMVMIKPMQQRRAVICSQQVTKSMLIKNKIPLPDQQKTLRLLKELIKEHEEDFDTIFRLFLTKIN